MIRKAPHGCSFIETADAVLPRARPKRSSGVMSPPCRSRPGALGTRAAKLPVWAQFRDVASGCLLLKRTQTPGKSSPDWFIIFRMPAKIDLNPAKQIPLLKAFLFVMFLLI